LGGDEEITAKNQLPRVDAVCWTPCPVYVSETPSQRAPARQSSK